MKTTVEIEWDDPKEQAWLCADNISLALHAYCKNTKFKVKEAPVLPTTGASTPLPNCENCPVAKLGVPCIARKKGDKVCIWLFANYER